MPKPKKASRKQIEASYRVAAARKYIADTEMKSQILRSEIVEQEDGTFILDIWFREQPLN